MLQRRLLWQRRLRTACWILAAAIAGAFVLGMADYLLRFKDPGLRIMATSAWLVFIGYVVYRTWYLPGRVPLQPLNVARRLESHFPQLHDSVASAIEFLQQSEHESAAGSPQLRRLVIAEAQNNVESLPITEIASFRSSLRTASCLAAALLLLAACLYINHNAVATAIARLALPLGTTSWPRQHHLEFRDVPKQLAAGQTLEVELVDTAGPLPEDVRLEFGIADNGGRRVTSEPMIRTGDVMLARRENVQQSFGFRAEGGDDDSMPWHWVEVVEPPRVESLQIKAHPPTYTGLPVAAADPHLELLAGTGIEVSGNTDRQITAATIQQDGIAPIQANILADTAGQAHRAFHIRPEQWVATKSGPYKLLLTDADGITSTVGTWNLRVVEDSPPTITWQQPTEDLFVLPQAMIPIELLVKDNLAVHQVRLLLSPKNDFSIEWSRSTD